jgi:hypothetical protein
MDNWEAFQFLLAELGSALQESLARHYQMALRGELDAMEAELDRHRSSPAWASRWRTGLRITTGSLTGAGSPAGRTKCAGRAAA